MDYIKPEAVVTTMVSSGASKGALPVKDLLIRGFLSGALLGCATSLAIGGTVQTGVPLVGALIFGRPVLWYLDGRKQDSLLECTPKVRHGK